MIEQKLIYALEATQNKQIETKGQIWINTKKSSLVKKNLPADYFECPCGVGSLSDCSGVK